MDRIEREALDWLVRRADGLDAEDDARFQAWLAQSREHEQAFAKWRDEWRQFNAIPDSAVDALRRRLAADKAAAARTPAVGRPATGRRLALAGACLSLLVAGALAWGYWWQPVYSATYATARGEQADIRLPDGSRMQLDTATRIEVALYRSRRTLRMDQGQARFEVSSDRARPFSVHAGGISVTVVGTRFAVRHTPDIPGHQGVLVAVEEGRVRVARPGGDSVELGAGQQLTSNADGMLGPVQRVAGGGIAPWSASRVSFDNVPLRQVLAEFERYGDTMLVIRDPAVAAMPVTGTFDPRHPENFARLLPQALPVRLSKNGEQTEIRARK